MKNTSKLLVLCLGVAVLFAGCKAYKYKLRSGEVSYPALGLLLLAYHDTYFKDPKDVQDLLHFFNWKELKKRDMYKRTIYQFKKDKSDMNVRLKDGYVEIVSGDSVLCSQPTYSFDDTSLEQVKFYMPPVAYGRDQYPVREEIGLEIQKGFKDIRRGYRKREILHDNDEGGSYIVVEYLADTGKLIIKNEEDLDYLLEYPYFKEISDYFKRVCKQYKLSRIMWATHLFYNP